MKQTWLATFLDLSHGVPSADTLRRVIATLLPGPFRQAFVAWAQALVASTDGKLVAIAGKTARGSTNDAGNVLHVVRSWVKENALVRIRSAKTSERALPSTTLLFRRHRDRTERHRQLGLHQPCSR
ncbi:ISAs1 family transposase, partial [bacterium]